MDPNSPMAAFASLDVARKAIGAAVATRDFNNVAAEVSKLNEALLSSHNQALQLVTSVWSLQAEKANLTKEIQELKEAALQRDSYTLVEISDRVYVYRSKVCRERQSDIEPVGLEPEHHVCQRCFDMGQRVVLQRKLTGYGDIALACLDCGGEFLTDETMSNGIISKERSRQVRPR